MANTVEFKIQVSDGGSIRTVTVDGENLSKVMREIKGHADEVNGSIVNWSQAGQAASLLADVVGQISSVMGKLTGAYAEQVSAETRLAQAMRNTMGASDEEIESIKQLASEQQKLGIIGDEVQLAAAQELATYLEYSESLKTIIPVMNDMIAQQYGFNASAESAAQIASMLGKVMNGQTEALSRYGYKFDEAQKQILKFGDESERAAVLSQLVSESVGGINFAQAETDAGRMKQLSNSIGDVHENLGRVIQRIEPFMSITSSFVIAAAGAVKLATSIKSLIATVTTLRISTAALYATMTLGISVAVTGLVALFTKLGQKGEEAAEGINDAKEAQDAFKSASMDMRLKLAEEAVQLEAIIKSKKDTTEAIKRLNTEYGSIFGTYSSAAEWYDVLTKKSAAYCRQLGYEEEAKVRARQIAAKTLELEKIREKMADFEKKGQTALTQTVVSQGSSNYGGFSMSSTTKTEYGELTEQAEALTASLNGVQKEFEFCTDKASEAAKEIGQIAITNEAAARAAASLSDEISDYRRNVENAAAVNRTFHGTMDDEDVKLLAMQNGLKSLIQKYGDENQTIQDLVDEYYKLAQARRDAQNPGKLEVPVLDVPKLELPDSKKINKTADSLRELYGISGEGESPMGKAAGAIGALSSAMGSLNGAVSECTSAWLQWGANLLMVIAQALPKLAVLFAANTAVAGSEGAASVASVPYVGPILAVAAVASIAAAIASLPKFANGGIAYGPTLGLFGEYSNASSNPEVVAPLDRLRSLIGDGSQMYGDVRFEIEGSKLVGVLERRYNKLRRTNG